MSQTGRRRLNQFGLGLGAFIAWVAAYGMAFAANEVPPQVAVTAQSALRAKVADLGGLKPWQKAIFENEVVPMYQAFIKSWANQTVELDQVLLKSYMNYRCATGGAGQPGVASSPAGDSCDAWLLVRAEKGCAKCEQAVEPLKKLAENRLLRRGFSIVPMTPEVLGIPPAAAALAGQVRTWPREREFESKVLANAAKNQVRAVISIAVRKLPPDSPDDPHADEEQFGVHAFVAARGPLSGDGLDTAEVSLDHYAKFSDHLEYQIRDSSEPLLERLLTEGVTRIAENLNRSEAAAGAAGGATFSMEISGVRSFQHAARVRMPLESLIRSFPGGDMIEKSFMRGRIQFEVRGVADREALKSKLAELVVGEDAFNEAPHFRVEDAGADGLKLELQARVAAVSEKKE